MGDLHPASDPHRVPGPARDHHRELRRAVARAGRPAHRAHGPVRARPGPAQPGSCSRSAARSSGWTSPCRSATSSGCRSAVQGDLGYSIQSHRPIAEEIAKRIPPTLALMAAAILIAMLVGIPLGILAALRPYSQADYGLTTVTLLLSSVPDLRPGSGRHLHLRGLAGPPAKRRHADPRQPELGPRLREPPGAARDGAGPCQRGAAAAVHAGEHARGAQRRVRRRRPRPRA